MITVWHTSTTTTPKTNMVTVSYTRIISDERAYLSGHALKTIAYHHSGTPLYTDMRRAWTATEVSTVADCEVGNSAYHRAVHSVNAGLEPRSACGSIRSNV